MFDWLRQVLGRSDGGARRRLFEKIDALNANGGGDPVAATRFLGSIKIGSGTLAIGDPQYGPGLEIPNISADEVGISASVWQYPSGAVTVAALTLDLGASVARGPRRKIGEVSIDSGKLVIADKADIEKHWTEVGPDRIGIISTAPDDTVLRLLTRRFNLKTVRVNPVRAEVVGPVSEALANEIESYLKSDPRYSEFTFMYFHVQTNNSFDRVNFSKAAWAFLPIGDSDAPLMFICDTGWGDGVYDLECEFSGDVPSVLSIAFIESST